MIKVSEIIKNSLCRRYSSLTQVSSTIYALSSGHGKCGVAVIRISGPNSGNALKLVTGATNLPQPRHATLRSIQNPNTGDVIDKGIVLWFPGPKSFTGEDCCELQVHGGIAVVSAILQALGSVKHLRLARPGEFTRRAFFNGKLDLTEVEGLSDLLAAETEIQRKQAFLQMHGVLSDLYKKWRQTVLKCLANLEAHIDFSETETIDTDVITQAVESMKDVGRAIEEHLESGKRGERLRSGAKTVIVGEPNVGKSSLFNALCQRPAAIVTPIEGTTRDVLEVTLDINGYPLVLADTAGLRSHTNDVIEREGISRTLQHYDTADLVLLVIDCANYLNKKDILLDEFIDLQINNFNTPESTNKTKIVVLNKADLLSTADYNKLSGSLKYCLISCKNKVGFDRLIERMGLKLRDLCGEPSQEHPCMNQARHRQHLTECLDHVKGFLEQCDCANCDVVLMAEDVRRALSALGKLTGNVTSEEVLDVIFKEFCVGK